MERERIATGRRLLGGLAIAIAISALLMLAVVPVKAWVSLDEGDIDIMEPGATAPGDINAKKALAQGWMTMRNKSGSTMAQYDPVIVDGTAITVVSSATGADGMTIAESLSSEGGPHYLMVAIDDNAGEELSGTVIGTDQYGASQTETVTFSAAGIVKKSSKFWKTITTVNMANLSAVNVQVYAYPANGIKAATSNVATCIGFTAESIADNAEGSVATRGFVSFVPVRGAAILPGDALSCAGSGYLDEDDTAPIAIALEPCITTSADELIRALVLTAND